ncbi:MAG: isoaspartyl peptidase/L-asparaginase [Bacteroidetes bacterium]|nr:isoaspartyl peptidase/L-asparaginase [Bacteroidota bacterium]
MKTRNTFGIAIHGGAGTISKSELSAEKEQEYHAALEEALSIGHSILAQGGTAIDAVEMAINSLENCPLFNAGKGAVFCADGRFELDASIMNGKDLSAGAVAGVKGIANPISLARKVFEKTQHVLLAGKGAMDFAKSIGVNMEEDAYFHTEHRYKQWQDLVGTDTVALDHGSKKSKNLGTVGAVAYDKMGDIAAGTSTGGMTNKAFSRVGDTPIIGSGTYANNKTCAISCTGHGEFFLRAVVAYDISCLMEYGGLSLEQACEKVVNEKLVEFGGEGGLIAVDNLGNICLPYNSDGMYRGWAKEDGVIYTKIHE